MTFAIHSQVLAVIYVGLLGAAAFATVAPLQMWVLEKAQGAGQSLASSFNIAAFNLGNAAGAWLGGVVIAHGPGLGAAHLGRRLAAARGTRRGRAGAASRQRRAGVGAGRRLPRRRGVTAAPKHPCPDRSHDTNPTGETVVTNSRHPVRHAAIAVRHLKLVSLALAASLMFSPAIAGEKQAWVGTWLASPQSTWGADFALPVKIPPQLENQTIRQTVRISLGGRKFRVVLSNEYTGTPVQIGEARVAVAGEGSKIVSGTDRALTFGGQAKAAIAPGTSLISDPVDLPLDALSRLSVSVYLPQETPLATFHWDGKQTAYIGDGNQTASDAFAATQTTDARILLSEILVDAPANDGAVVAIGDSITDGAGATLDADNRWPTSWLRASPRSR